VKVKYWKEFKVIRQVFLFLLILLISSDFNYLFSQNVQTKPSRQSSLEAFSKGNYEEAYREFGVLLQTYSKDPMYNYYSGICLVKLNRSPEDAISFLKQAMNGTSVVKTLPSDALFYLGRAQQMAGHFNEALETYDQFTDKAGKKAARELGVPEYIQQCNGKKGAVEEPVIKQNNKTNPVKAEIKSNEVIPVKPEVVLPSVETRTTQSREIPLSTDKIMGEAINLQYKSDSVTIIATRQKTEVDKLSDSDKQTRKKEIAENEALAASFQKSADQKYKEAELALNPTTTVQSQQTIHTQSVDPKAVNPAKTIEKPASKDTVIVPDNNTVAASGSKSDTLSKILHKTDEPPGTFELFNVLPEPVSDPKAKITIDPELPAGLIYRIQVAVFRNPVAPSYFKGIEPVYGFKIAGTDKTNYFIGMFRRSVDASKALSIVKAKGFRDSFIVALFAGKTVSADRAAILEKEWGKIPFRNPVGKAAETTLDTIPPALSFRVEVIRSEKPLKADIVAGIEKMAGGRQFDIQPLSDGKFAYLIGNFITFDSAGEYADLLTRNGYREARVVAFLGKKEIPVETAKQLLESVK
jgi:hypothetical protein